MKCPYCGNVTSRVLNSRPVNEDDSIKRRRQCEKCNRRFTTYEKVEMIPLMVIKKNHSREIFNRDKLLKGIVRSCNKRNISLERIEELVHTIETKILDSEINEISSTQIGEITMRYLKEVDEVSYIRFASVYKQFMCIEEFIIELENIKKAKDKRTIQN
ncbi:MAG: transcriptional regulator NrdR [Cellulosilyticum sp.]|nr:transcriptional repressor NrdR [Cellulosilyticum sp.]MEE1072638.1 transcriptional regulator NrdR [Cellulosilyticum sp.]